MSMRTYVTRTSTALATATAALGVLTPTSHAGSQAKASSEPAAHERPALAVVSGPAAVPVTLAAVGESTAGSLALVPAASQGSPSELRRRFGAPICRIALDDATLARRVAESVLPGALGHPHDDFTVDALEVSFVAHGGTEDLVSATRAITSPGLEVVSVSLTPPSLDDVFLGTAFASDAGSADSAGSVESAEENGS